MLFGAAQSPPSAPPATPAAPAASAMPEAGCPIDVMAVLPLPGNGFSATYAAFLASARGAGLVSGTLWVNTSMGPFHVPFLRRMAVGDPYTKGDDPIVFSVPAAGALQSVFVDSRAEGDPCQAAPSWVPGYNALLDDRVKRAVQATLKTPAEPAVATSISDPVGSCRFPNTEAHLLNATQVFGAPGLNGGTVRVRVHLAADSSIVSAEVDDPNSAVRYYNPRALAAARSSVYATRTVNCRPVESDYLFNAVFS